MDMTEILLKGTEIHGVQTCNTYIFNTWLTKLNMLCLGINNKVGGNNCFQTYISHILVL